MNYTRLHGHHNYAIVEGEEKLSISRLLAEGSGVEGNTFFNLYSSYSG
jgi:hypothetical protein